MTRDRRELGKIFLEGKVHNVLQRLRRKKEELLSSRTYSKKRESHNSSVQMIKTLFLLAAIQAALSDTK